MTEDHPMLAAEMTQRAILIRWLAGVFAREQTRESLAALGDDEARSLLRQAADATGTSDHLEGLLSVVDARADRDAFVLDLATDFARLFLGAAARSISVHPYESLYTGSRGTLFQQATADMEALLREYGLAATGSSEPADHVAVELEFLAQLTADWLETGKTEVAALRERLLREHILIWVPEFCTACIQRDRHGFYAGSARLLDCLLRDEVKLLSFASGAASPPPQ